MRFLQRHSHSQMDWMQNAQSCHWVSNSTNPHNVQNHVQFHLQPLIVPIHCHAAIVILTPLITPMILAHQSAATPIAALAVFLAVGTTMMIMIDVVADPLVVVLTTFTLLKVSNFEKILVFFLYKQPVSPPHNLSDISSHAEKADCSAWHTNSDENLNHPVHFDSLCNHEDPITATYCVTTYPDDDSDESSYIGGKPSSKRLLLLISTTILTPKPRNKVTGITPNWTHSLQLG